MFAPGKMPIAKMAPVFEKGWGVTVINRGLRSAPGITSETLYNKNKNMASWLNNIFNADIHLVGFNPDSPYRITKLLNFEHKYQTDHKGSAMHFFYFKLQIEAKDRSRTTILDTLISDILNRFIDARKLGKGQEVSISAKFAPNSSRAIETAIVFEGALDW